MKYFLDTEFIERFHKPLFGKPRHVIDLISIGIVADDGRTYSAISNEYRYKDASPWVQENVIRPLYRQTVKGDAKNTFSARNFHYYYGKSNAQIAQEIIQFCNPNNVHDHTGVPRHEFYGYYCDYDWVLLCSLFGTMMSLPNGWPMYCRDLKQSLDEFTMKLMKPGELLDLAVARVRQWENFPQNAGEHDALSDAKWNLHLYEFLRTQTRTLML